MEYLPYDVDHGADARRLVRPTLAGNFFLAGLLEVIGEAFALAKRRWVLDPFSEMLKAFLPGSQEYLDRLRSSDFDRAGFTLDAGLKAIRLILDGSRRSKTSPAMWQPGQRQMHRRTDARA